MTTGERIKLLRKEIKLTQSEFGERIGLKQTAIGTYETGIRNVPDRTISQISQAFRVREEWLRFGEEPRDLPQASSFLNAPDLDDLDRTILRTYIDLPSEKRQVLKDYILQIAEALTDGSAPPTANEPSNVLTAVESSAPPSESAAKTQHTMTDDEIEAEVEAYRAALVAEQKGQLASDSGSSAAKMA